MRNFISWEVGGGVKKTKAGALIQEKGSNRCETGGGIDG